MSWRCIRRASDGLRARVHEAIEFKKGRAAPINNYTGDRAACGMAWELAEAEALDRHGENSSDSHLN